MDHKPMRPDWDCVWCAHAYPCSSAQRALTATFTDADGQVRWYDLHVHMAVLMAQAAPQLTHLTGPALHSRFIAWIRRTQSDMARANIARTSGRGGSTREGAAAGGRRVRTQPQAAGLASGRPGPQNLRETPTGRDRGPSPAGRAWRT